MNNLTYEQKNSIGLSYVLSGLVPVSAFGKEKAKKLPFFLPAQKSELETELNNVEKILHGLDEQSDKFAELTHTMSMTNNIIKSIRKTASEVLDDVELFEIKCFLLRCEKIKNIFDSLNKSLMLGGIEFFNTAEALDIVDPDKARIASFYISDACSARLRELRAQKSELERQISVTPKHAAQTLVSRHTETARLEEAEELAVRTALSKALAPFKDKMEHNAEQIARLDIVIAKAELAKKTGGTKPVIADEKKIAVKNMFNPFLADALSKRGESFTPLTLTAPGGVTIITGANMGGKSVALKTLALNLLLAQMGFFVFAESLAAPLFDFCYMSADAERADKGLSAFGGEIVKLNETYQKAKKGFGLIVIDEFAKGTNVTEGQAIFCAVVEALNAKSSITVMTTHYDDVSKKANRHYQVMGLRNLDKDYVPSKNVDENINYLAKRMNYGLREVPLESGAPKEAVAVCFALGLDDEILSKL